MARILLNVCLIATGIFAILAGGTVRAEEPPSLRINLIQTAGSVATYERVDLTNDSGAAVDMTDWRLVYRPSSGNNPVPLVQFRSSTPAVHLVLNEGQTESLVSKELAASAPASPLALAWQFAGGLSSSGGSLQLLDTTGRLVDMVGWGAATSKTVVMGEPAASPTSSTWLVRKTATGNNAMDFELRPQVANFPARVGAIVEVVDLCLNLPELQAALPEGYMAAPNGNCQLVDVCSNLAGVQADMPAGMEYSVTDDCVPIDACLNLEGLQVAVPGGYELTAPRVCEAVLPTRHILITELLPNPSGSDTGNEFIELYNADTESVTLDDYLLVIGTKTYTLPTGAMLMPGAYWSVSDTDLGVALPNTTGLAVYLTTVRGVEVATAPAYKNAPDDASWALVGNEWHYSYAPTPGATNVALSELPCQTGYERDSETGRCRKMLVPTVVAPCPDGQYRNETTGRCRLVTSAAVLVPCKEGQYRSEETGRCRSLASVASLSLKPCADDQFRNPLTNRCKAIASSEDVVAADCGEGRERNPDTHRCRNIVSTTVPAATFAVAPVKEVGKGFVGWWALGGVGLLAAGYGIWEWRRELATILHSVTARLTRK